MRFTLVLFFVLDPARVIGTFHSRHGGRVAGSLRRMNWRGHRRAISSPRRIDGIAAVSRQKRKSAKAQKRKSGWNESAPSPNPDGLMLAACADQTGQAARLDRDAKILRLPLTLRQSERCNDD
jgi:hypothetical protein